MVSISHGHWSTAAHGYQSQSKQMYGKQLCYWQTLSAKSIVIQSGSFNNSSHAHGLQSWKVTMLMFYSHGQ